MKKLLAVILAITLIFSCAAIPASAAQTQEPSSTVSYFEALGNIFKIAIKYVYNFIAEISNIIEDVITPTEKAVPALVAQNGKEDTVVIDRENNVVYGLKLGLRIEKVGEFVKVNDEEIGRLAFVQRFGNRISSGDTINVIDNETNEIVESFTVIIFSDVYNNGTCNTMDEIEVSEEAAGETSWSDPNSDDYCYWKTMAADLDKDGAITDNDALLMLMCVMGSIDVDQTTGKVITPELRLIPQRGKENTVVIDRENHVVYGLKLGLRIENVGDFLKVNYSNFGKLEFVQRFDNRISSGDTVNVVNTETNEIVESFTVIIFSDVYNNGTCNTMDEIEVREEADGETSWSDPESDDYCYWKTMAADLDKDGVITDNDATLMLMCVIGSIDVDQTTGKVIKPDLRLTAASGKENTVVIDRENNIIYGLKLGLRIENVGDFVKVSDSYFGKLEFEQRFDNRISCGDKIKVVDKETNEVIESFTVVIFGDVYENGTCNVLDTAYVKNEVAGETSWSDPKSEEYCYWRTLAADLDKDGVITEKDDLLITKCSMGIIKINQTTCEIIEN